MSFECNKNCKLCIINNDYEDLDEESKQNLTMIIDHLKDSAKIGITFFETVVEATIKLNKKGEIILLDEDEKHSDYLCDVLESAIGIELLEDKPKSIKVNEIAQYIANLPDD